MISLPGTQAVGHVISAPGTYCLATDVIMAAGFKTGNAIEIDANYITLDLNGHKVHGGERRNRDSGHWHLRGEPSGHPRAQ